MNDNRTNETDEKRLALMCAKRLVRLLDLDAPQNVLKAEYEILGTRIRHRLPQLEEGPKPS